MQECESNEMGTILKCLDGLFPFEGLQTKYLQEQFYKEHFNLIVSSVILFAFLVFCFC